MSYDFNNKTFRIVRNDGPAAEVTPETIFRFYQIGDIVHADYWGGGVRYGKLIGLLEGDTMRHSYTQINDAGEFHSGHSTDQIRLTDAGKIQLIDEWQWESKEGSGVAIIEEV